MVLHYLLLLFGVCQHSGPEKVRPPRTPIMPGLATLALIVRELSQVVTALFDFFAFSFVWMNVPWVFLILPACSFI